MTKPLRQDVLGTFKARKILPELPTITPTFETTISPSPSVSPSPTNQPDSESKASPKPTMPETCQLLGDIDCSCEVNSLDVNFLIDQYLTSNKKVDLDNSGQVNALDVSILLSNFGKKCN